MADALDMMTDAPAYGIGLMAVRRGIRFKPYSARPVDRHDLDVVETSIVADIVQRLIFGSEPLGAAIVGFQV
jgi:hypothetical protein